MKNTYKFLILLFFSVVIFFLTFMKAPNELLQSLYTVALQTKHLALIMHGVFFIFLFIGLSVKRTRRFLFSALLIILSGTALFISLKYKIIPNLLMFGIIFVLSLYAIIKKKISFDISETGVLGKITGFISLVAGFYYLHWVQAPIWKNALLYSPLGIINCPTLVTISGLLIFLKKPGSVFLEFFTGFMTLYFGFFGIMRLSVYIDVALVVSGVYILARVASNLDNTMFYKKSGTLQ